MLKTYTLYLRDGSTPSRFEPALCRTDAEAMARANTLLALHPECATVDVFLGDVCLFTMTAS